MATLGMDYLGSGVAKKIGQRTSSGDKFIAQVTASVVL